MATYVVWRLLGGPDVIARTSLPIGPRASEDAVRNAITEQFWARNKSLDQRVHAFPEGAWDFTFEKDENNDPIAIIAPKGNLEPKTVKLMLNRRVHHFLLPIDRELGDFLPHLVTHPDERFQTHCRAQVINVCRTHYERTTRLILLLHVHHIHLDRTEIEEDVKVDVRHPIVHRDVLVTDSLMTQLAQSLEQYPVWVWYDPTAAEPLENDSAGIEEWITLVKSKIRSKKLLKRMMPTPHSFHLPAAEDDEDDEADAEEPASCRVFGGAESSRGRSRSRGRSLSRRARSRSVVPSTRVCKRAGKQPKYAQAVGQRCGGKCILTGDSLRPVIQAAHIVGVAVCNQLPDDVDVMDHRNGVMMRVDLHRLWDTHGEPMIDFHIDEFGDDHKVYLRVSDSATDYMAALKWKHGDEVNFPRGSIGFLRCRLYGARAYHDIPINIPGASNPGQKSLGTA